jgi:PHD-zinc-finger like domain
VLCAMTEKARTATLLSSATDATWRSIKIAMVFLTSQRGSGSVGSALSPQRPLSWVWMCLDSLADLTLLQSCVLCPNEGGAFKQTSSGKWAHLLCAIWIPEVVVASQLFMEPIDHIEKIPKNRWRLVRMQQTPCPLLVTIVLRDAHSVKRRKALAFSVTSSPASRLFMSPVQGNRNSYVL